MRGPKGETRPADVIGNAVHVAKIATGEIEDDPTTIGSAGGKARARALTAKRRKEIARKAANTRWS